MLYFAYGANLDVDAMRARAPRSRPAGRARLPGRRFVIGASGYASIVPDEESSVEGLLWRVAPEDVEALDDFEGVAEGLYRKSVVTVITDEGTVDAWVYVETSGATGTPRPEYLEAILIAARSHGFSREALEQIARCGR